MQWEKDILDRCFKQDKRHRKIIRKSSTEKPNGKQNNENESKQKTKKRDMVNSKQSGKLKKIV